MVRNVFAGAIALTLLSGGAFAQSYQSQTTTTQETPSSVSRSKVEKTEGINGTETKRSEYQSNAVTGTTTRSSERHTQGQDGTINSSSTRTEQSAPVPVAPPTSQSTTTTTTTVR